MRKIILPAIIGIMLCIPTTVNAQSLPFNFVKQWEELPNESLASLVQRDSIQVVGSDLSRLDPGMVVNVVYLQNNAKPRTLYRCVEYTREWQMETIQTHCYVAIPPQPTK
ncbi:hypothetical protein EBR96_11125 [bacterium]|nr:hypothetical protein [bacterium]